VTEHGLFEALTAKQATILNAAMQNLTVTEKANFVDAYADQLYADEFTARVATLARAEISSPNLWPDPLFEEPGEYDLDSGLLEARNGSIYGSGGDERLSHIRWATSFPITASPGEQFSISAVLTFYGQHDFMPGENGPEVRVRPIDRDGNTIGSNERLLVFTFPPAIRNSMSATYTVPDDPNIVAFQVGFGTGWDTSPDISFRLFDLKIASALDGKLIVDGTIDARHLNVTEEMTAALARFLKVEAEHIEANAIDGMTIRGAEIVGGAVRGGVVEGAELRAGEGGLGLWPFHVETDGTMFATGATVDGHLIARSADLEGELRVGGNREGGLTPDNGRLRIKGRLPRDSGSARDMFVTGESSSFQQFVSHNLVSGERHDIVYPEPKPSSTTRVLATDAGFSTSVNMNISVGRQSASGFSAIAMASTASGRDLGIAVNYSYRISWIAYWRQ